MKSKKVDIAGLIVASIALLISMGHAAIGLFFFLQWPDVKFFPPDTILINYERFSDGECVVRFAAVMSFLNPSRGGHNVLVQEERLEFTIDGVDGTYVQKWHKFIRSDSKPAVNNTNSIDEDCREGSTTSRTLEIVDVDIASPFIIAYKNAVSHETYFSPSHIRCPVNSDNCEKLRHFIDADNFEKLIRANKGEDLKSITFKFVSEIVGYENEVSFCKVTVDKGVIGWLERRGWTSARCWALENDELQT